MRMQDFHESCTSQQYWDIFALDDLQERRVKQPYEKPVKENDIWIDVVSPELLKPITIGGMTASFWSTEPWPCNKLERAYWLIKNPWLFAVELFGNQLLNGAQLFEKDLLECSNAAACRMDTSVISNKTSFGQAGFWRT